MGAGAPDVSRRELASFLRARRDELQPEEVGLPRRGRRRVKGLRRHEVADLAAVSDTWYTWLEQGRSIRVSAHLLDAVARALRLDEDGWRYVRRLAGVPVIDPKPSPNEASEELRGLVDDMMPSPACLTTGPFDFLAWNAAYARLFGDPADLPPSRRNALWLLFAIGPTVVGGWEEEAHDAVGRFRAEAAKYPDDPRFQALITDMRNEMPDFSRLWETRQVGGFRPTVQEVHLPDAGSVRLHLLQLRPLDQPALVLMVHRPVDEASRRALDRLVIEDEQLAT